MTLKEWLSKVDGRLERVEASLEEHMRRTAAAEARLETLQTELQPLKTHVAIFGAVAKGIPVVIGVLGGLLGILQLLGVL